MRLGEEKKERQSLWTWEANQEVSFWCLFYQILCFLGLYVISVISGKVLQCSTFLTTSTRHIYNWSYHVSSLGGALSIQGKAQSKSLAQYTGPGWGVTGIFHCAAHWPICFRHHNSLANLQLILLSYSPAFAMSGALFFIVWLLFSKIRFGSV